MARHGSGSISERPVVRALIVLVLTILVIVASAILLPPKGSNAMPRDGTMAPAATPR